MEEEENKIETSIFFTFQNLYTEDLETHALKKPHTQEKLLSSVSRTKGPPHTLFHAPHSSFLDEKSYPMHEK